MLTKHKHIPFGLVVRIPGFHPGGSGSIPGMGSFLVTFMHIAQTITEIQNGSHSDNQKPGILTTIPNGTHDLGQHALPCMPKLNGRKSTKHQYRDPKQFIMLTSIK